MDDGIFLSACIGSGVLFLIFIIVGFKCAQKGKKKPPIEFPSPSQPLVPVDDSEFRTNDFYTGQEYQGHSDVEMCNEYEPPTQQNLSAQSSFFADRSRSAKGPDSDSLSYDNHPRRPVSIWNRPKYVRNSANPKRYNEETTLLVSNGDGASRRVSAQSIDGMVLHHPVVSPITRPRLRDDMMLRKMKSPTYRGDRQRSRSIPGGQGTLSLQHRQRPGGYDQYRIPRSWGVPSKIIWRHTPHSYGSNEPYYHPSSASLTSTSSNRRKSVKEMVNKYRTDIHNASYKIKQEERPYLGHQRFESGQMNRIIPHDFDQGQQVFQKQQPIYKSPYKRKQTPPPLPLPPRSLHLTPPPPPDFIHTPPPLPSPPKFSYLKSPQPVWVLRSPPILEDHATSLTPPPVLHSQPHSTPPHHCTPPNSPMYIPSTPVQFMTKPVLMQTNVVPSPPAAPPLPSPKKPVAKPVLLHTPPTTPPPRRPHTPQKPIAKPVMLYSPQPPQPTPPPPTPPPQKPVAKPVLLSPATSPSIPIKAESPPTTPKPSAKPVLLQSPPTRRRSGKSPRQLSAGGISTPPPLPLPPTYKSILRPAHVADPSIRSPPAPAQTPPPPPLLHEHISPTLPLSPSPTKPTAKPVLLSPQQAPSPVLPMKYKTKLQVSPRIQAATNAPKHKTVFSILPPRRQSLVLERGRLFSQDENQTSNNSPPSPSFFQSPPTSYLNKEVSARIPLKNPDEGQYRTRHVHKASPEKYFDNQRPDNENEEPESEIQHYVQDIINRVSEENLSENTIVNSQNESGLETAGTQSTPNFTPQQTSTPYALSMEMGQERLDPSQIPSPMWQQMTSLDTITEPYATGNTWMSINDANADSTSYAQDRTD